MSDQHWYPGPRLEFLTGPEVKTRIRRSMSWIYKAAERGELPAIKIGGRLIFATDDIDAYIEAHRLPAKRTSKGGSHV